MFKTLTEINEKPEPFGAYTADALWADEYRSKKMLSFHLNEEIDVSSRNWKFIDVSCDWIVKHFDLHPGKAVCDFGCGPGLYTSRLARSGAEITGVDFSVNSIEYARQQAKENNQDISYEHANYLNFETKKKFDLITMIMCDFCALSPEKRKKLLSIFHNCLKDNGKILLDVYSAAAFSDREEASFYEKNQLNQFWAEDDYYCFVNIFKYEKESVILDKYTVFREEKETEVIYNWLQYFSPDSLRRELSASGFEVTQTYKDVSGALFSDQAHEFAIVATKDF